MTLPFLELRHDKQLDQDGACEMIRNSTLNVGEKPGGTQVVARVGVHA